MTFDDDISASSDPVPARVRDILALFEAELSDARFGDLDGSTLQDLAERARERAAEVDAARATLDDARDALDAALSELTKRADQGLAYARVFAADGPLAERLAALEAPSGSAVTEAKKVRVKRTKSAPKRASSEAEATELPFEERGAA